MSQQRGLLRKAMAKSITVAAASYPKNTGREGETVGNKAQWSMGDYLGTIVDCNTIWTVGLRKPQEGTTPKRRKKMGIYKLS